METAPKGVSLWNWTTEIVSYQNHKKNKDTNRLFPFFVSVFVSSFFTKITPLFSFVRYDKHDGLLIMPAAASLAPLEHALVVIVIFSQGARRHKHA